VWPVFLLLHVYSATPATRKKRQEKHWMWVNITIFIHVDFRMVALQSSKHLYRLSHLIVCGDHQQHWTWILNKKIEYILVISLALREGSKTFNTQYSLEPHCRGTNYRDKLLVENGNILSIICVATDTFMSYQGYQLMVMLLVTSEKWESYQLKHNSSCAWEPVEVVKGRILAGWALKPPEPWASRGFGRTSRCTVKRP